PPPPTTELSTLSLHDALPISGRAVDALLGRVPRAGRAPGRSRRALRAGRRRELHHARPHVPPRAARRARRTRRRARRRPHARAEDRKSTRLNSSHRTISYAVF